MDLIDALIKSLYMEEEEEEEVEIDMGDDDEGSQ